MSDQYRSPLADSSRNLSFDTVTLLTTSTINTLHFPGLSTSGIADPCGSRRTSILLDGLGMCDSMTESFCSTGAQDDALPNHHSADPSINHESKLERKDSTRKRRSRKALYDATVDGVALDKIETVNLFDGQNEPDDAWLADVPVNGEKQDPTRDNIFSWVHQEFQSNDINASKHRLLCKLDDMSNARTIRSLSCHNFLENQNYDNVKRSSTEQHVHSEPLKTGRLSSPLRSTVPSKAEQMKSPAHVPTVNGNGNATARSREASKERLDYTDLEVMAKMQLENLRQSDRQGPLSKRFSGSNVSLASTSSATSVSLPKSAATKPPVAPKSAVIRTSVRPNLYQRSNTQTIVPASAETLPVTEGKPPVTLATRVSLLPPNSATNPRTRPPTLRPIQTYRGSQTTVSTSNGRLQVAPSSVQRPTKKLSTDFGSTYTSKDFSSNENGLLNDVSNKPLTGPLRSHVGTQRRTMLPQTAAQQHSSSSSNGQSVLPRSSSSSFGQGRKSGVSAVDKPQKPTTATVTRHHSLTSRRTTMNRF